MILRVMMPILPLVRVPNVYKLTKMAKITSAAIVEISGWGYFYYSYKNDAGLKRYFLNIMQVRVLRFSRDMLLFFHHREKGRYHLQCHVASKVPQLQ